MIETHGLSKVFHTKQGPLTAVRQLDLRCERGQIYALLGPNGAGKTTALRILSTLIAPTHGEAFVGGHSVARERSAVRKLIGVVSYETATYERMTPREIGMFFGRLHRLEDDEITRRLDDIFGLLRMRDFADTRTDTFSTGMKQKTVIMRALVTEPDVLIFDEPTSGLDTLTAKNVLDHIRLERERGKTILFSTHVLWEAERVADKIGIIDHGTLVEEGTLTELQQRTGRDELEEIFFSLVENEGRPGQ